MYDECNNDLIDVLKNSISYWLDIFFVYVYLNWLVGVS